jgi:hypothetical protein
MEGIYELIGRPEQDDIKMVVEDEVNLRRIVSDLCEVGTESRFHFVV